MGIKINWKGEIDGDDEHLTDLFVQRNDRIVEEAQKNFEKIEDIRYCSKFQKNIIYKVLQT